MCVCVKAKQPVSTAPTLAPPTSFSHGPLPAFFHWPVNPGTQRVDVSIGAEAGTAHMLHASAACNVAACACGVDLTVVLALRLCVPCSGQKLSRKLVHTTTGPIYALTWALFR